MTGGQGPEVKAKWARISVHESWRKKFPSVQWSEKVRTIMYSIQDPQEFRKAFIIFISYHTLNINRVKDERESNSGKR